jgi:hypothetical protein
LTHSSLRGTYGIRIDGIVANSPMLGAAAATWPSIRLESVRRDPRPAPERVTADRAEIVLKTGGRLVIDREQGVARYSVPRPLTLEELVHPYLAPTAAVLSHWAGRLAFHAGGFSTGNGVWGMVGDREAGKSSQLARLALDGHAIVTDDVLVIDGGQAHTGPRAIDLREQTADRLGIGASLGMVGARPRWRVRLPPLEGPLPFRGWFFLGWDERIGIERLDPGACLARLLAALTFRLEVSDPPALLALATLPAWELRRPRDWATLDATTEILLDHAG